MSRERACALRARAIECSAILDSCEGEMKPGRPEGNASVTLTLCSSESSHSSWYRELWNRN